MSVPGFSGVRSPHLVRAAIVRAVSVARAAKAVRSAAGSVMLNSATTGRSVQHFLGSMTHAFFAH
ncbi:hypothetical protein SMICM304S_05747 [Streptomyces microflavus]